MDIDKLNKEIKECRKCRLWETRTNALCGEGTLDGGIFLIAQAPGEKEDKAARMFVGPSGKVLDELLKAGGVRRNEVYMTNLIKCILPRYRKPQADEIKVCAVYLEREIELFNPRVLVPLGYYAANYVFEKYKSRHHLQPGFRAVCGKLFFLGDKKVFPLRHPSALLHNPTHKQEMIKNYSRLNVLLKECKWYPICPMKGFYEEGRLERKWVELYCKGYWKACKRYQMEEKGEYHPDWMLPDGSIEERLRKL